jgi:PPK2 family polyphosphate:nucleotide phosphotransferase
MNDHNFQVPTDRKISLQHDYDPGFLPNGLTKEKATVQLQMGIDRLAALQDKLYAQNTYGVLMIFQAMDAAGKDGTIKHVMSGINPQGCQVYSFKTPTTEELDHDYLWRYTRALPERGRIGIFNRSYYEEVLIARVHPEILDKQQLPHRPKGDRIWAQRFQEMNHFEDYLTNNGIIVLKFFLNLSKEEQKKRFLKRIDTPERNWKFSMNDIEERQFWDDYQQAYEDMLNHTSTPAAPWTIIPADRKWYTRLAVAEVINARLLELGLDYPTVSDEQKAHLKAARTRLME